MVDEKHKGASRLSCQQPVGAAYLSIAAADVSAKRLRTTARRSRPIYDIDLNDRKIMRRNMKGIDAAVTAPVLGIARTD